MIIVHLEVSCVDSLVFGQRLKYFRKRNNYTLVQLGETVRKPAPYLSQLENGLAEPRVSFVRELAAALDCTPADLLDPEPFAITDLLLREACMEVVDCDLLGKMQILNSELAKKRNVLSGRPVLSLIYQYFKVSEHVQS